MTATTTTAGEPERLAPDWLVQREVGLCPCGCIGKRRGGSFLAKTLNGASTLIRQAMFADDVAAQHGVLQRVDPRVKLVTLIGLLVATAFLRSIPALILMYVITLALAAASRLSLGFFVKRVWLFIPIFTGIVVLPATLNVITDGHIVIPLGTWFGHRLGITSEGLHAAAIIVIRVATSISLVVLLTLTTPWNRLLAALRALFVPRMLILVLGMAYRYLFHLLGSVSDMYEARRSRTVGTDGDVASGRRFVAASAGALFGKAHAMSEEVYMAMVARGTTATSARSDRHASGSPTAPGRCCASLSASSCSESTVSSPDVATEPAASSPADRDLLRCADLRYRYLGRFTALDGVSLAVGRGEKVALLGANGCGKSTLLKLLDGLLFADSGTYRAFGEPVTEDNLEDEQFSRGFRARVGFIFQNSDAQVFSPTVRDEIAFGPLNMGLPVDHVEQRVADTLRMLEIEELADRAPYQLSGGQKKRVAIASVLVMNPEVLLFDEPTAALDPRTQRWLIELIVELNRAGKTIVLATHDLDTLDVLADRCVVFAEDHTIAAEGTPDRVLADRDLLLAANLVHVHRHSHQPGRYHAHPHDAGHHDIATDADLDWSVPAISGDACRHTIDARLRPVLGVESVDVDTAARRVRIRYRTASTSPGELRAELAAIGYPPE